MSTKKIGGEYGDMRENIPIEALNQYLSKHAPPIKVPVVVKQFQVSVSLSVQHAHQLLKVLFIVWAGGYTSFPIK